MTTNLIDQNPVIVLGYPKIDHEKNYVYYWMPFSILTLANAVLTAGVAEVILFDGNQASLADWKKLLDDNLDRVLCVGISIMTGGGQIAHGLAMAQAVRECSAKPIVFGGPHVNVLPEQTLSHSLVDAVLVGLGQVSIVPYVQALKGERALDSVPGLLAKTSSGLVRGPASAPKALPLSGYPWHLVDVERYIRDDPTISSRTLNYVSSQGCVYKCQFCYELTYRRKYNKIPADTLLREIAELIEKFAITGVKFYDADWFVDLRRADAFSKGLLDHKLDIRWAASVNPNDILLARERYPHLLRQVADSGCGRLLMGVESGSDRVLNEIVVKEITRSAIVDVAHEIADAGIIGSYTFIVGFPGETEAEQAETFCLIEELWALSPTPETRVHLFAPYPGTPLYETAVASGFAAPASLEGWAQYDYYECQTPWTDAALAEEARNYTKMRLMPIREAGPVETLKAIGEFA